MSKQDFSFVSSTVLYLLLEAGVVQATKLVANAIENKVFDVPPPGIEDLSETILQPICTQLQSRNDYATMPRALQALVESYNVKLKEFASLVVDDSINGANGTIDAMLEQLSDDELRQLLAATKQMIKMLEESKKSDEPSEASDDVDFDAFIRSIIGRPRC